MSNKWYYCVCHLWCHLLYVCLEGSSERLRNHGSLPSIYTLVSDARGGCSGGRGLRHAGGWLEGGVSETLKILSIPPPLHFTYPAHTMQMLVRMLNPKNPRPLWIIHTHTRTLTHTHSHTHMIKPRDANMVFNWIYCFVKFSGLSKFKLSHQNAKYWNKFGMLNFG